jgi:hypothetical protein
MRRSIFASAAGLVASLGTGSNSVAETPKAPEEPKSAGLTLTLAASSCGGIGFSESKANKTDYAVAAANITFISRSGIQSSRRPRPFKVNPKQMRVWRRNSR